MLEAGLCLLRHLATHSGLHQVEVFASLLKGLLPLVVRVVIKESIQVDTILILTTGPANALLVDILGKLGVGWRWANLCGACLDKCLLCCLDVSGHSVEVCPKPAVVVA